MKKILTLAAIIALGLGSVSAQGKAKAKIRKPAQSAVETNFQVDPTMTQVLWTGKKVGGQHNGKISVENGNLILIGKNIKAGQIVIDMNSITCDDIKDAKSNSDLVGHLKNEDFFNVGQHPKATLDIISGVRTGKVLKLMGTLTIKGISNPVSFQMAVKSEDGSGMIAGGKLVFDRTKYDVKYGSTLFGAAADKAIDNDVKLDISLVAKK